TNADPVPGVNCLKLYMRSGKPRGNAVKTGGIARSRKRMARRPLSLLQWRKIRTESSLGALENTLRLPALPI
ncbi:hypothetical protein, partial [Pseudomonas viridiflava]|uniref:hypothetical protein n=1 Tax=Pseudomonas viridiflava TaxID=33069 RepID=UPI0019809A49